LADIGGLRNKFNGLPTLSLLLSKVYPDYNWLPWKFAICPPNYWDDLKNRKKFMGWASKQLGIKDMSDWYKVTQKVMLLILIEILNFQAIIRYWRAYPLEKIQ
jgi:hypothetical protein